MSSYSDRAILIAQQRQSAERASRQQGAMDYSACGPPTWSRDAWEAYKAQYGKYPFGLQGDGSFIPPPHTQGAPDWVFELMGYPPGRVPPFRGGGGVG